ncbi:MAG: hypothetical protein HPY58_03105 [Firmicutes bacterium]|nr:hypothetical protein [Bacillota bacterium]
MEKVLEQGNMLLVLRRVERNKRAAGVDGMEIKFLSPHLIENRPRIKKQLLAGTYQAGPLRRVEIPKPDEGVRLLGIPTVLGVRCK